MSKEPKILTNNRNFWSVVSLVDENGTVIGSSNPIPVNLSDNEFILKSENGNKAVVNESGQLKVVLDGTICENNSTNEILQADEFFTGEWENVLDYAIIQVVTISDKNSAVDGLEIQFSTDGINIDNIDNYTVPGAVGKTYSFQTVAKYFRIKYTNGNSTQTYFRLQSIKKKAYGKPSSHRIQAVITTDDDAELVKAVLTGRNEDTGFFENVLVSDGEFNVVSRIRNATGNTRINPATTENQTNGTQVVYLKDFLGNLIEDTLTSSLKSIDYGHSEIHAGSHYFICDYETGLSDGDTIEFVVTTPDSTKWTHMELEFTSILGAKLEIYRGINTIVGGTPVTAENNNQNSENTSDLIILKDPTSLVDGTRIAGFLAGANRVSGFNVREKEIILKQNETYLFRFTSDANSNAISFCGEWYEHTNK